MTVISPSITPLVVPKHQAPLQKGFWIGVFALFAVLVATAHPQYGESALGAALIIIAALLPGWLWVTGRVPGLPLFPIFAATHLGTFAFPLLFEHPIVLLFPPDNQLIGALTVAGFLFLGTIGWYQIGRWPGKPVIRCLILNPSRADGFFLCTLGFGIVVNLGTNGAWFNVSPEIFAIIRAVALALEALACFVLAFRMGNGSLRAGKRLAFNTFLIVLAISTLPGLLLINAMSIVVIAALGYTLGAHRFPWRMSLLVLSLSAFLHVGKGDMRNRYWKEDEDPVIQPGSYPSFLLQWVQISSGNIISGRTQEGDISQSLLERASLMQLLLYVEAMTPSQVPYMGGDTYTIIPELIVPRIFDPEKPASHEGTYRLNIHYGFQTREETAHNTVGFGLLNEAYANFGYLGAALLAVFMGAYYGAIARWARATPVLSFRSLFAIIIASYAFQVEFSAGVYASAVFQSTCALFAVAALFMRRAKCGRHVGAGA